MKNSLFIPVFCFFLFINGYAQNIPAVLGAVLEVDTEIIKVTPFAGIWVNGLGFARVGVSTGNMKETDSLGVSSETKRLDISAQIGFSAIGPERPYIAASYVRNKVYSPNSDVAWHEWGLGIGHRFSLSPYAAIVIEAEHRWIAEHYDRARSVDVSGRKFQMNFGLVVYPY
jgi:hypothetical protein